MNLDPLQPGLNIILTGAVVWIVGLLLITFVPPVAAVGAVLTLVGQVIFWLGVVVLAFQLLLGLIRR